MKKKIFIKNVISEFDFLKDEKNSLKSGYVIDVGNSGFLIPLNIDLIKNKELIRNIQEWNIKYY